MEFRGVTGRCSRLWREGATALIGISPFNSYFSEKRIVELVRHCGKAGRPVVIFVPDDVTRYTLQARGYSKSQAARKTRRQVNYLRNKIRRATAGTDVTVYGCAELDELPAYRRIHDEFCELFGVNSTFRRGCLQTTRWVLQAAADDPVSDIAALLGARYFLAELPLFVRATDILGIDKVVFIYHQCPDFVASLYQDPERRGLSAGQGFGILSFEPSRRSRSNDTARNL